MVFSTGTDEHGQKVEAAASSRGVPVREWCDKVSSTFSHCASTFNVSSTVFTRTSSADHGRVVRWMWRRLESRGFIYLGMHEGWYCPSEEAFLTEANTCTLEDFVTRKGENVPHSNPNTSSQSSLGMRGSQGTSLEEDIASQGTLVRELKARKADKTLIDAEVKVLLGLKAKALSGSSSSSTDPRPLPSIRVSAESGHPVEWLSEENYKFRLSSLTPQLTRLYSENKDFVLPRERLHSVAAFVEGGEVKDLSVSRKRTRVPWAWEVPNGDGQHSIYVWLDALCSYLTSALADDFRGSNEELPENAPWEQLFPAWPADLQVVGKDILKFHALYWPAFLLAAGLPPPKCIIAHGHFTVGQVKMSKSLGNVVCPLSLLQPLYQPSANFDLAATPFPSQSQTFMKQGQYTPEGIRFALLREGIVGEDGDFNGHTLEQRAVKECADTFGNLASRLLTRRFMPLGRVTLAPIILALPWGDMERVGGLRDPLAPSFSPIAEERALQALPLSVPQIQLLANVDTLFSTMEEGLKEGRGPYSGLAAVTAVLQEANQVFTSAEPWKLAWSREGGGWQEEVNAWERASQGTVDATLNAELRLSPPSQRLAALLYTLGETLRVTSILAQLATPKASSIVLNHLGFSTRLSFEEVGAAVLGLPPLGHPLSQWDTARVGFARPSDFSIPREPIPILFPKVT